MSKNFGIAGKRHGPPATPATLADAERRPFFSSSADREVAALTFSILVLGIPSISVTFLLIGWMVFRS